MMTNTSIQTSGELFEHVQRTSVFPDCKTFVDCEPKSSPQNILSVYHQQKENPDFSIHDFVHRHFELPGSGVETHIEKKDSMIAHIEHLWDKLTRSAQTAPSPQSSLLPLPKPYVVPGGRFREIYYWDSFFTMLGLVESGKAKLVKSMVDNFTHLIQTYGHIPNGNRNYFLSRSQPPFFACMVDLLIRNSDVEIDNYLPALKKEYAFWMNGAEETKDHFRRVALVGGMPLNRYWDDTPIPREESWREDVALAETTQRDQKTLFLNVRAACESGWDFSSRWLGSHDRLASIRTTELAPIDLNCLLYFLEKLLAENLSKTDAQSFAEKAKQRRNSIQSHFWNKELNCFCDFDLSAKAPTSFISAASIYPLYFKIATAQQAEGVRQALEKYLLQPGGILTTPVHSGQQWDAPNGWPPLQWIAVIGCANYGFEDLAKEIAQRWLDLNESTFIKTGKMMEKYDVVDLKKKAGGGEYALQDGFGWTNGVALALHNFLQNASN